jgi:hypothetical protein
MMGLESAKSNIEERGEKGENRAGDLRRARDKPAETGFLASHSLVCYRTCMLSIVYV